jgi:hypothetical protein
MNTYTITLYYPRTTRQQPYTAEVEAKSRSLAIATAKLLASEDGWQGEPHRVEVNENGK